MSKTSGFPRASSSIPPDFTTARYQALLELALTNYVPRPLDGYEATEKCFIVRHDVDFSLNRAVALAEIEREMGISASYLVDPHSMFYNMAEKSQVALLRRILELGHTLGLHFDANFHEVADESELDSLVGEEADWIEFLIGARPSVMSFHNPSAVHLEWQGESYAGLVNCYSSRLMDSFRYVSDSNGYWRFRQLHEVLLEAAEPRLQILIHPGWWQETEMPPRQRIFRASFGRAAATIARYDRCLDATRRTNLRGLPEGFEFLQGAMGSRFMLFDYLWNEGHLANLFLELWRLHEMQLNKLCRARFRKQWRVPAHEVNALFASDGVSLDGWKLFGVAFGETWEAAVGVESGEHRSWVKVRNQLIHGRESFPPMELQRGCSYLSTIVANLAAWGLQQSPQYDGIAPLGSIGLPTVATADGSLIEELDEGVVPNGAGISRKHLMEWEQLKGRLLDGQATLDQP